MYVKAPKVRAAIMISSCGILLPFVLDTMFIKVIQTIKISNIGCIPSQYKLIMLWLRRKREKIYI